MTRLYQSGDELVSGYHLSQLLGRGGFGQVWKCLAPGGTEVALKIIDLSRDEGLRELRALVLVRHIRHVNLVPIMACWVRDDDGNVLDDSAADSSAADALRGTMAAAVRPAELLIAMGLGEKNLLDRLQECRDIGRSGIPVVELLAYMENAATGLDFLNGQRHDLGSGPVAIQHCDIKPQNMVIIGGAVQVCDFGLARVLSDTRLSRGGMSVAYAAPEIIGFNRPSQTTDQYSLAISYVELRTGRLPFCGQPSVGSMINAHLNGVLDLGDLKGPERAVIQRATDMDPGRRFPSCMAMVRALRQACGLSDGRSSRRSAVIVVPDCDPPPKRRAGRGMSLVTVAAGLLVIFGGWTMVPKHKPAHESKPVARSARSSVPRSPRSTGVKAAAHSSRRETRRTALKRPQANRQPSSLPKADGRTPSLDKRHIAALSAAVRRAGASQLNVARLQAASWMGQLKQASVSWSQFPTFDHAHVVVANSSATLLTTDGDVVALQAGDRFRVTLTRGEWSLVEAEQVHSPGSARTAVRGWVARSDIVPLARRIGTGPLADSR